MLCVRVYRFEYYQSVSTNLYFTSLDQSSIFWWMLMARANTVFKWENQERDILRFIPSSWITYWVENSLAWRNKYLIQFSVAIDALIEREWASLLAEIMNGDRMNIKAVDPTPIISVYDEGASNAETGLNCDLKKKSFLSKCIKCYKPVSLLNFPNFNGIKTNGKRDGILIVNFSKYSIATIEVHVSE